MYKMIWLTYRLTESSLGRFIHKNEGTDNEALVVFWEINRGFNRGQYSEVVPFFTSVRAAENTFIGGTF